MKSKRIVLIALAALVALSAFGVANAQSVEQRGRGPLAPRQPRPILNGLRHAAAVVGEATGLDRTEIIAALRDGRSLADVIAENDASVEAVKAELTAPFAERLATAVENGRITQEQADTMLVRVDAAADRLLNHVFERLSEREAPFRRRHRRATEL